MRKSLILSLLLFTCLFYACDDDDKSGPSILEISSEDVTVLEMPFLHEAASRIVPIQTNLDVIKVSSIDPWCKPTVIETDGKKALHVSVYPNTGFEERTTEITLYAKGVSEIKIPITQWADEPNLMVLEEEDVITIVDDEGYDFELNITSSLDFTITQPEWVEDRAPNYTILGSKTYKFSATPMKAGEREGEILITVEKEGYEHMSKTIKIVQTQQSYAPVLTSFSPTSAAKYSTITLSGQNFGIEIDNVKVYFNDVEVEVKSVNMTTIEVVLPLLKGADVCDVSVVIDGETVVYTDKFNYEKSWEVTTVTGNGNTAFKAGTLAEGQVKARYLAVDSKNNIFVSHRESSAEQRLVKINEEENSVVAINNLANTDFTINAPFVGPNDVLYVANDKKYGASYYTYDPANNWAEVEHTVTYPGPLGTDVYFYRMLYNPNDEHFYGFSSPGLITRIDPKTDTGTDFYRWGANVYWYAAAFDPNDYKNIYITVANASVGYGLWLGDITNLSANFTRLNPGGSMSAANAVGLNDGPLTNAGFGQTWHMVFDKKGEFLYVSDHTNHVIRKIDIKNKTIETILGIAGSSGTIDGNANVAKFSNPRGIAFNEDETALYVSDFGSSRIRKCTYE